MTSRDRPLWPPGESDSVAKPNDAILVAKSLKAIGIYSKIQNHKRSIELITRRLGVSFDKENLTARAYIDRNMLRAIRDLTPSINPSDLLKRFGEIMKNDCAYNVKMVPLDIGTSDIEATRDQNYYYLKLDFTKGMNLPRILRVVLLGEAIKCADDILAELDLHDGCYRA